MDGMGIDRRKNYYMVLDTETCNGIVVNDKLDLSQSLVYDIGFQVIDKKGTVYLNLTGTNSLTDGRKYGTAYSDEHKTVAGYIANASESKGTFHAKGVLNISAADSSSKITITEGYKHGINASDTINFYGGIVTVNSTGRNGFQCKNAFNMYGGTAIVYGSGAHTNNESRGIVVEGDDTGEND